MCATGTRDQPGVAFPASTSRKKQAKALCVITPAAIGPQYFREAAESINAAAGRAAVLTSPGSCFAPRRRPL